ncbi:MAG: UDP-3-O-[3-hydroxymyristoyl] N-acetylglucosamine deacetylase [Candidatus Goldiibacteriota bacterium HGW-Goldbacteria-1]|jgi:UDP-3-O-acyl N-acetylglucosamine deacetylase|nr:MAG: UDP-3-O-[3-hydroxymyristoyl] N-acetylglucosamine deacetylase [Candidatus Goldiibacteriota bacterium HGW-Goldbacteria-1]
MKQLTLKAPFELAGRGLHKGSLSRLVFHPASAGSGITVKCGGKEFKLSPNQVCDTKRGTTVKYKGIKIHTVEHMTAAFKGQGIDNVRIEFLSGNEPPIFDGSAAEFVSAIKKAGVKILKDERKMVTVKNPLTLVQDGSYLTVLPYQGFKVYYFSDFSGKGIPAMEYSAVIKTEVFNKEIAPARTFGFKKEIDHLIKAGLIKGADLNSAILFDGAKPVNTKLRFKDEVPRHKLLDVVGDFGLLEGGLNMLVIAVKTGHRHNTEMVKRIAKIYSN